MPIITGNKKRNKWLISVGQVSEGVDIPHLRVGVYLTTTQSHLADEVFE